MRIRLGILGALLAIVLPASAATASARYINPFADPRWGAGRIDMGMDWAPLKRLPVLAVGDAMILGSDNHSRWPGHHIIWYQLTDGPLRGAVIYFAEHITHLIPAGQTVRAGQQIATAVPGYPYIEMGWADQYGSPRAASCYKEGKPTNSGREMARFLQSLGADIGISLRPGPAYAAGRLC